MTKKLVKHGNSLALLIEKPLLKILGIDEQTNLHIKIEGNSLIVEAEGNRQARKHEIREIAQEIMDQYDPVFRKLSKT